MAPGRISNLMVLEARETLGIDIGALRADLRAALPDGAIDAQLDGDRIVLTARSRKPRISTSRSRWRASTLLARSTIS